LKKIWRAKLELNINMNKNEIIFNFWIMPQKLNVTQPVRGAVPPCFFDINLILNSFIKLTQYKPLKSLNFY